MANVIDKLEERVSAVSDLVKRLRANVVRLEGEISTRPAAPPAPEPAALAPVPSAAPPTPADAALREELALLRAERQVVREKIRGLIREIDQVSW